MASVSALSKLSPVGSKVYMGILSHKNGTDLIAVSPTTLGHELRLPLKDIRSGAKECVILKFLEPIGGTHFRVLPMPNGHTNGASPAGVTVPAELILAFREVPREVLTSPANYTAYVARMLTGLGYTFAEKVDTPAGKIAFMTRLPKKIAIEIGSLLSQSMLDRLYAAGADCARLLLLRGTTSRAPSAKGIVVLRSQIALGVSAHAVLQCFEQATRTLRVKTAADAPFGRQVIKLIRVNLRLGYTLEDLTAVVTWAEQRSREDRWPKLRSLPYLWGKEFPSHLSSAQAPTTVQAHDPRQYLARVSKMAQAPLPDPLG